MRKFFLIFIFLFSQILAEESETTLARLRRDLATIASINTEINDSLPIIYNSSLSVGYLNMPSARMSELGVVAVGGTHVPPYNFYNVLLQPFSRIELVGNYRVYYGVLESNMGSKGFGDDADRGLDAKIALLTKSDGFSFFPEIALGAQDFVGSKRFEAYYLVGTYEILPWNIEVSLGYGLHRIDGLFGGVIWSPFRKWMSKNFTLSFVGEYDAINYEYHEAEHWNGRSVNSRINIGAVVTIFDMLQLKISSQRGEKLSFGATLSYNFGDTDGFFAKREDPPLPTPIPDVRYLYPNEKQMAEKLADLFQQQGLSLHTVFVTFHPEKTLYLSIINLRYRDETTLRSRIELLLASCLPEDIDQVIVCIESNGIPAAQYTYHRNEIIALQQNKISFIELAVLSPMEDPVGISSDVDPYQLYHAYQNPWDFTFRPRLLTFFGSSTGKFKYSFGVTGGVNGYILDTIYYEALAAFTIKASIYDMADYDFYNPSQLLNVRTDAIAYFQQNKLQLDHAYLQKGWSFAPAAFARICLGYLEPMYGGVAAEMLYYPAQANWAVGIEGAGVLKRKTSGLGFTTQIRRFEGYTPVYEHFIGYQYFLDLYYNYKPLSLDFGVKIGSFLARDKGARFEVTRNYKSGMKLMFWYAWTNANDIVNNRVYHDTGLGIFLPLDIFLQRSSRSYVGYAMSFWLRDCGAFALTGKRLYPVLREERLGPVYSSY